MILNTFKCIINYLLLLEMFVASYHYEWETRTPECSANETFAKCARGCFEPRCSELHHDKFEPTCPTRRPGCVCIEPYHRDDFTHHCVLAVDCRRYEPIMEPRNEDQSKLEEMENINRSLNRKRKSRPESEDTEKSVVRIHAHQSILSLILPEELLHMKKVLQSLPVKVIVRPPREYRSTKPYIAIIIPKLRIKNRRKIIKPPNLYVDFVTHQYHRKDSDFQGDYEEPTTMLP